MRATTEFFKDRDDDRVIPLGEGVMGVSLREEKPVTETPTVELVGIALEASTDQGRAVLRLLEGIAGKPPTVYRPDWFDAYFRVYLDAVPRSDATPFHKRHPKRKGSK